MLQEYEDLQRLLKQKTKEIEARAKAAKAAYKSHIYTGTGGEEKLILHTATFVLDPPVTYIVNPDLRIRED